MQLIVLAEGTESCNGKKTVQNTSNDQINLDGNYCCEENMETHHSIPVHPLKQSQCHATTCEVYKSIDVF